jgi:type I restriction enzyme S subunit
MSNATTHIETEKQLVPELRFNEFEGEWENNRLHGLTNLITKGTTPKTFTSSGVNYVKIEGLVGVNINKDKCVHIDEEVHLKELKRSILQENDLLFAIAGATVGKVGIVTSDILPANTNQALAIIRLKNKEYLNYILQILQSRVMKKYIYQSVSVGAQPNLNLEQIGDFRFNLPSLPEQQKIASFLSAVDQKIQQLTKKKALLEDYKKGVMQQLFSGQLRFKDENGNPYPVWERNYVSNLSSKLKVGFVGTCEPFYTNSLEGILLVRTGNLKGVHIELDEEKYVTKEFHEKNKKSQIYPDDLLLARHGGNGEICRVPKGFPAANCLNIVILRTNSELDTEYFQYAYSSFEVQKQISAVTAGSTQGVINTKEIGKLKIDFPCIQEQQKIATYLSGIDTKIEAVNNQITQTQTFKKGLLQQMFV